MTTLEFNEPIISDAKLSRSVSSLAVAALPSLYAQHRRGDLVVLNGRYGDPLNIDGNLAATAELRCLLRPGGLLFLGVPTHCREDDGTIHPHINLSKASTSAMRSWLSFWYDIKRSVSRRLWMHQPLLVLTPSTHATAEQPAPTESQCHVVQRSRLFKTKIVHPGGVAIAAPLPALALSLPMAGHGQREELHSLKGATVYPIATPILR